MNKDATSGLTMIELLVVMTIGAIVTSVAFPSMSNWLQDNRLQTIAQSLAGTVRMARSEAISRNQLVKIEFIGGGLLRSCVVTATTDTCDPDDADSFLKSVTVTASGVVIAGSGNVNDGVVFGARGRLQEGGAAVSIGVCDTRGAGNGRVVQINQSGRASARKINSGMGDSCTPT